MIALLLLACSDKASDTAPATDSAPAEVGPIVCTATLPADVWAVSGVETTNASGAIAWICDGGSLTSNGASGAFFVSAGGSLTLNGADALVYAQSGAQVTLNESGTTVYHEDGATIALSVISTLERCDEVVLDASAVISPCP